MSCVIVVACEFSRLRSEESVWRRDWEREVWRFVCELRRFVRM